MCIQLRNKLMRQEVPSLSVSPSLPLPSSSSGVTSDALASLCVTAAAGVISARLLASPVH